MQCWNWDKPLLEPFSRMRMKGEREQPLADYTETVGKPGFCQLGSNHLDWDIVEQEVRDQDHVPHHKAPRKQFQDRRLE